MVWNGAQFHLLVNHIPVIGFLLLIPALVFAMVSQSRDVKRAFLWAAVMIGLSSFAAFWTGEPAEDTVEKLPGIDKHLIHEHEEAADFATGLGVITAIAAAGALFGQRKRPETLRKSVPAVLFLSIWTFTAMAKTAHDGGKIRHSEIRNE